MDWCCLYWCEMSLSIVQVVCMWFEWWLYHWHCNCLAIQMMDFDCRHSEGCCGIDCCDWSHFLAAEKWEMIEIRMIRRISDELKALRVIESLPRSFWSPATNFGIWPVDQNYRTDRCQRYAETGNRFRCNCDLYYMDPRCHAATSADSPTFYWFQVSMTFSLV